MSEVDEPIFAESPRGTAGLPIGPMLYPRMLRLITNALDALDAIGAPDTSRREGDLHTRGGDIAIHDDEKADDTDPNASLLGWLCLVDLNCWVFVPHVDDRTIRALGESGPVRRTVTRDA